MRHDSSVDIATHYGLVGSGIEFAHPGGRAVWNVGLRPISRVRIPPEAWMFVLCVVTKGKMQDNEDKDTSTDPVHSTREHKKILVVARLSAPSTRALWPTQPPIQQVPGRFPRNKAAEAWC